MLKSELIKLLTDIPGDAIIVTRMNSGRGFNKIKSVYKNKIKVRDGKMNNGMQNKMEYCGDILEAIDAIVLEEK